MVNESRLIGLFKQLCLINAPALAEAECASFVKKHLTEMGLEVREDNAGEKIGGNANNIIATLKGNKPGAPHIYLSAHLDTVEPTAGLIIEERNGVLYSASDTILGADDKGGMAPAIEAIAMLQEQKPEHGDVTLLFSVAEEIGLKGADALEIENLNLDFGYVLDTGPPVGTFVSRTATHDKLDVIIYGVPAHAGKDPENGVNAIAVAADAISGMKLGRIGPETTSNFGIIDGGTAVNVVCPFVRLRGEARSTDIGELDKQINHMTERFEEAAKKWGATVTIDHKRHYRSYNIDSDTKVVDVAQRAAKALGMSGELRTTLGGSDANVYNSKGLPSLVMATGMEAIHTHAECISIASLVDTARLAYQVVIEAAKDV